MKKANVVLIGVVLIVAIITVVVIIVSSSQSKPNFVGTWQAQGMVGNLTLVVNPDQTGTIQNAFSSENFTWKIDNKRAVMTDSRNQTLYAELTGNGDSLSLDQGDGRKTILTRVGQSSQNERKIQISKRVPDAEGENVGPMPDNKDPVVTRRPLPLLLGKTQTEVQNILGAPSRTERREPALGREGEYLWIYILESKPIDKAEVNFQYFKDESKQASAKVIKAYLVNFSHLHTRAPAKEVLPNELYGLKPQSFYLGGYNALVVVWELNGDTYIADIWNYDDNLISKNRSVDPGTGKITETHQLGPDYTNWPDRKLFSLTQYKGKTDMRNFERLK